MACPYFYPVAPRGRAPGPLDSMLPLGDQWTGTCRAAAGSPCQPDEASLRPLCNLGYARGACVRFPADDGPDAFRFTILRDQAGAVGISYVVERDHHPFAHGRLEYSFASGGLAVPPADEILARQAQAYAESYRRRKRQTE